MYASLRDFQLLYLHCATWPHALPPHPRLQTSYPRSTHFVLSSFASSLSILCIPPFFWYFPIPPASSFSPDSLKVLQWNTGGLRASNAATLHFISSHPLGLIVSKKLILTHHPLSGSLDFLLCDLITPPSRLAFSFPMTCMIVVASSFSSGSAYPSLSFLPHPSLCLTPILIM